MQAAAIAVMAVNSILFSSTITTNSLIFPLSNNPNTALVQPSSFHGVSLKSTINRQSLTLSAVAPKPLTVVAATKKAVAVLKGTSSVEGVVTLTQQDDGLYLFLSVSND